LFFSSAGTPKKEALSPCRRFCDDGHDFFSFIRIFLNDNANHKTKERKKKTSSSVRIFVIVNKKKKVQPKQTSFCTFPTRCAELLSLSLSLSLSRVFTAVQKKEALDLSTSQFQMRIRDGPGSFPIFFYLSTTTTSFEKKKKDRFDLYYKDS
jgi:hypothetical protein